MLNSFIILQQIKFTLYRGRIPRCILTGMFMAVAFLGLLLALFMVFLNPISLQPFGERKKIEVWLKHIDKA